MSCFLWMPQKQQYMYQSPFCRSSMLPYIWKCEIHFAMDICIWLKKLIHEWLVFVTSFTWYSTWTRIKVEWRIIKCNPLPLTKIIQGFSNIKIKISRNHMNIHCKISPSAESGCHQRLSVSSTATMHYVNIPVCAIQLWYTCVYMWFSLTEC